MAAKVAITDDVLQVLKRSTITGTSLVLPDETFDRPFYIRIDKVLRLAGGQWVKSARAHVFKSDPVEILGLAIKEKSVVNKKQQMQEFFTPPAVAEQMCTDVCSHHSVLEPSAGNGRIAKCALENGAYVKCYELQEAHVAQLNAVGLNATACDFLTVSPTPVFDFVLMNPPFNKLQCQQHVRHAAKFLNETGRLIAVMPAGLGANTTKKSKDFMAWLEAQKYTSTSLPDGTFKQEGTPIATCLLTIFATP